ncbi:L-histidine N(alpha)-methyltransferase [Reichenbachiella versicolor]|uniref:L-histidine N(alpha)-methyltransferase n=1 Tax=Reichenbachiella versicolor TaxID=1821036 RepID=UPI000D6E761C|nr:L-histidine N(alpha)-methyltransferase [Reichenbachiella versicolor]
MFDTIEKPKIDISSDFYKDVISGLNQYPKSLSSKYFYDKKGDQIFQQIMELDEYYLTRAEFEIFNLQADKILDTFSPNDQPFNLIEFGAGDGLKTKVLLKYFLQKEADFSYLPIDISQNALNGLASSLNQEIPELNINTLQGDYFEVLDKLSHQSDRRNILLFLGSNIGNFTNEQAKTFLSKISQDLNTGDLILLGIDLKKKPESILAAYSDKKGVTAEFNLNLLDRINHELDGDFERSKFIHNASYDPITGDCKSSLLSKENQTVTINGNTFHFDQWEPIHTEISKKYSLKDIETLGKNTGFEIIDYLFDRKKQFTNTIWRVI